MSHSPAPGVLDFVETEDGVTFTVEADEDAQITVGLKEDTEYDVTVDNVNIGTMKTNLSGKLSISIELANAGEIAVKIVKNG